MHAALQLTEISEVVCEFLDPRTLACLARTCRVFEGPALDALWKVIPMLYPLASIVPDSVFDSEEGHLQAHRYRLLQPLSPQQWRVIRKYTSRISVIASCVLWCNASYKLHAIAVHSPPSSEPLFPKLKAIQGVQVTGISDPVALLCWLNGPSMARLDATFSSDPPSEEMIDFVSSMHILYPNMKSLTLSANSGQYPVEEMVRSVSRSVRSWKHLVHVGVYTPNLDTAAYEHLMGLEYLTSLTLTFVHHFLSLLRRAVLPRKPFPALTDLTLRGCHIPWAIEWLDPLHLCLHSLSCSVRGSFMKPSQFADLCRVIAAQLCHKSLQRIRLRDDGGTTIVQVDTLRPLFSFSRLRCVEIAYPCVTSLSDDSLLELASSWPLLEFLDLSGAIFGTSDSVSMPTFKGFFHLLRNCPHLQRLVALIDTRNSESVDVARYLDGIRNHPMDYLCLGNSPIDDAKRTASILRAVLPSLKKVDLSCWDDYLPGKLRGRDLLFPLWREVNRHLDELRRLAFRERLDSPVAPWGDV